MSEFKIVTKDELWLEFKRGIDSGNWKKFKTRRGFDGYISRLIKKKPGKELTFLFSKRCVLKIK